MQYAYRYLVIIFVFLIVTTCSNKAEDTRCQKFNFAKVKALKFLDSIEPKINPVTLRKEHGMKGKKHFVEYISTYLELYDRTSSVKEKNLYRKKVEEVIAPIYTSEYHNLAEISFEEFKEDVISYINACVILEEFGFDTKMYIEEVKKVLPLITSKEHLDRRGVNNNMAITYCLNKLGFNGSYSYDELYNRRDCIVRTHPPFDSLDFDDPFQKNIIYDLTHEIFFLTNYGTTKTQCINKADMYYLKDLIPKLISKFIGRRDPDIVAELLVCLNYMEFKEVPQYGESIDYLLASQNPDGSWGNYTKEQKYVEEFRPAFLIDVGQYLHSVEVVLWALDLCLNFHS